VPAQVTISSAGFVLIGTRPNWNRLRTVRSC